MGRVVWAVLLLGMPSPAWAECTTLTTDTLQALITEARTAVFQDDLATFERVEAEVQREAPCLEEQVPPSVWAPHLITRAIVSYAKNEDWQPQTTSRRQKRTKNPIE